MMCDFFKIRRDDEAILDLRDLSKVQMNTDNVPVFGTKWDEVLSAVTDRPTDSILESLYRMQIEKSEETYVIQVYTQEATTCAFGMSRMLCVQSWCCGCC